jgi:signal transduction histidine kinase
VELSTIPAAWIGREPAAIAAGLADVLMGTLHLDFVFVRLSNPNGGAQIDVTRGTAWKAFPEWLHDRLSAKGEHLRKEIVPDVGGQAQSCRGLVLPIGLNAAGGLVAVACVRPDFPTETDQLLLTVALNHTATGFESTRLINERHRTEEELRQARADKALHEARRELTLVSRRANLAAVSAGIAHEIKQPLAAIVTNASAGLRWLAKTPPELDEVKALLKRIVEDGHRAGDVIQSVRAMFSSNDQSGEPFDLNELIRETVDLAHGEATAENIAVRLDLASELPSVSANRAQLQQVILNLVVNAIDAMRGITDRPRDLQIESKLSKSNGVEVAVTDSGTGIGPENIDRIFDAFFTTKSNGMGMGLSICRSIVESHAGRLSAMAAYPRGSVFQIALPRRSDVSAAESGLDGHGPSARHAGRDGPLRPTLLGTSPKSRNRSRSSANANVKNKGAAKI